jgi:hypothetical protein
MALAINDKQNTDAPSALYPQGNIRDNDGTGNGTPVNKQVYADFHQFFARILVEAGISPNHIPENAYDGFQYIQALKNVAGDLNISYSATGLTYPGAVASAGANLGIRKTVRNTLKMQGVLNAPGSGGSFNVSILRLPIGYRPSIERWSVVAVSQVAGSNFAATMQIMTDGNIVFSPVPSGVVLSGGTLSFYLDIEVDL